jgi:hypothetical protein
VALPPVPVVPPLAPPVPVPLPPVPVPLPPLPLGPPELELQAGKSPTHARITKAIEGDFIIRSLSAGISDDASDRTTAD